MKRKTKKRENNKNLLHKLEEKTIKQNSHIMILTDLTNTHKALITFKKKLFILLIVMILEERELMLQVQGNMLSTLRLYASDKGDKIHVEESQMYAYEIGPI